MFLLIVANVAFFRRWYIFYATFILVVIAVFFFPIENDFAVVILFNFLFDDLSRSVVLGIYIVLLILAILMVYYHVRKNLQTSPSVRKIFHVFLVAVFLPGLWYQCTFLFIATVVILAILILLEVHKFKNCWLQFIYQKY